MYMYVAEQYLNFVTTSVNLGQDPSSPKILFVSVFPPMS